MEAKDEGKRGDHDAKGCAKGDDDAPAKGEEEDLLRQVMDWCRRRVEMVTTCDYARGAVRDDAAP